MDSLDPGRMTARAEARSLVEHVRQNKEHRKVQIRIAIEFPAREYHLRGDRDALNRDVRGSLERIQHIFI